MFAEKATGMLVVFVVLTTGLLLLLKLVDCWVEVDAAVAAGTIDAVTSIASIAALTKSAGLRGRALALPWRFVLSDLWYAVEK